MNSSKLLPVSRKLLIASIAAVYLWFASGRLWSHPGCGAPPPPGPTRSKKNDFQPLGPIGEAGMTKKPMQAPHGGQVNATDFHYFEVVYLPHETRVFMYGPSQYRYNARGVTGSVVFTVNGNAQEFRYPLQLRAEPAWSSNDKGYLVASVDVTRIRDGDMEATFDIQKLHRPEERTATFSQTFGLTRDPLEARQEMLYPSDQADVKRQGRCPVHNHTLGEMEPVVKLIVGDRTVFACRGACATAVLDRPGHYVAGALKRSSITPVDVSDNRAELRRLPACY